MNPILFQSGEFTLNSGAKSAWKLECDALTDDDWRTVAVMVRQMIGAFSAVTGVPTGGLKLADALRPFATPHHGPHLIVDDVLTTGGSMERTREGLMNSPTPGTWYAGAVLFARGQCPHWVRPVFQMPECFWIRPKTRG